MDSEQKLKFIQKIRALHGALRNPSVGVESILSETLQVLSDLVQSIPQVYIDPVYDMDEDFEG